MNPLEARWPACTATFVALTSLSTLFAQQSPLASPQRAFATGAGAMLPNTPYRPNEHAVADFDGDGSLDIAFSQIGNFVTPQVSIAFNNGDGTYDAPLFLAAPGETAAVCAADIDGDGDPDLAFTQSGENGSTGQSVIVYRNLGGGAFGAAEISPCGKGPTAIAAADFDLDGDLDLLTVNRKLGESDVSWLHNDGTGHFTRTDHAVGPEPYRLAVGDLDGDGRPDIVTTHVAAVLPAVSYCLNTGSGFGPPLGLLTGGPPLAQPGPIPAVSLGDVDGDGDLDVLYGYAPSSAIPGGAAAALWKNNGNGTFGAVNEIGTGSEFASPWSMQLVDVTGDGVLDVIGCGGQALSWWGWMKGLGDGTFTQPVVFSSGEYSRCITAEDIDSDGDRDVLITNHGLMTIQVHRNDGGTFPAFFHLDAVDSLRCEVADVDLDGDLDIVALAVSIYTYINDGSGSFTRKSFFPGTGRYKNFLLRDLDGDGRPEILKVKDSSSAPYHFYTNRNLGGGNWSANETWTLPNSCGVYYFTALDFDNDGDLDVACNETGGCASKPFNQVYLLRNQGNGTFAAATTIDKVQWGMSDVDSADLDGDGNVDLVGVGLTQFNGAPAPSHGYLVLKGNGTGGFAQPVAHSLDPFVLTSTVRAADMNQDGAIDLVGAGLGTWGSFDQVVVMLNDGAGDFIPNSAQPAPKSLNFNGTNGICVADFSNDGKPDILVGGGEDVVLYLNDGTGSLLPGLRHGIGGMAIWVAAGDFNGDSLRDAAAIALRFPVITLSEQVSVLFGRESPAWIPVGKGIAGTKGVPTLAGSGTLEPSSPAQLELKGALPNVASSALIVGVARVDLPLFSGILVPSPDVVILPLQTSPLGAWTLSAAWPSGIPSGSHFYFQAWIPDPSAPVGVAASRGLEATTP